MSNTKLPNICAECGKRTNVKNRSDQNPDLCKKCFSDAELELDHFDNHQEEPDQDCKFCEENLKAEEAIEDMKAEDAPATKQAHFDHSACDHPKTAKDRAQCRKTGLAAVFHGVISELPAKDD